MGKDGNTTVWLDADGYADMLAIREALIAQRGVRKLTQAAVLREALAFFKRQIIHIEDSPLSARREGVAR